MRTSRLIASSLAAVLSLGLLSLGCAAPEAEDDDSTTSTTEPTEPTEPTTEGYRVPAWQTDAATSYLDQRSALWFSQRDCALSCHTTHPFMLASGSLGMASGTGSALYDAISARVASFPDVKVWYGSSSTKTSESLGTEAILNASAIIAYDSISGSLSDVGRSALTKLWDQQHSDGGFSWLDYDLAPWETRDAAYYGAALAAMAVGNAPDDYAANEAPPAALDSLRGYLVANSSMNAHRRVMLLLAAAALDGILSDDETAMLSDELLAQQGEDGGWNLASLGSWTRVDGSPNDTSNGSDPYATGLLLYALREGGVGTDDPRLQQATQWLVDHQDASGQWWGRSLNRDAALNQGFADDAATAWAVMGLAAMAQ